MKFNSDKLKKFFYLEKNDFKKVIIFHIKQFLYSKVFWIFLFLILTLPIIVLVPIIKATDLYANSYLFALIVVFSMIFFIFYLVFKLFSNNSNNFVDETLITKGFDKKTIYIARILIIYTLVFACCFFQSMLSVIITTSTEWSKLTLNVWLIMFFGQIISTMIFVPIFIYVSIKVSSLYYIMINFLIVIFLLFTSIIGNALMYDQTKNNNITFNKNNLYNYQVIQKQNKDKKIAISINNGSNNNLININNPITSINYINNAVQAFPGMWLLSPIQLMFSNGNIYGNDYNFVYNHSINNYQFSLNKFTFKELKLNTDFINKSDNQYVSYRLQDKNLYNLNINELYDEVLLNISEVYNDLSLSKWQLESFSLLNEKIKQSLWLDDININEKRLIASLLGLDDKYSSLYYFYNDYDFHILNISNIYEKISSKYNKEFANLVNFIWTSNQTKYNVFKIKYFNNLYDFESTYPSLKYYDDILIPKKEDIDFIKNILIKFDNNKFKFLNSQKLYDDIDLKTLNPQILDLNSWYKFIDDNSLNLNSLKNVYMKLKNISPSIYDFDFSFNSYKINNLYKIVDVVQQPWFDLSELSLSILMITTLVLVPLACNSYIKKNIK